MALPLPRGSVEPVPSFSSASSFREIPHFCRRCSNHAAFLLTGLSPPRFHTH